MASISESPITAYREAATKMIFTVSTEIYFANHVTHNLQNGCELNSRLGIVFLYSDSHCDQYLISLYNVDTLSSRQVRRLKRIISEERMSPSQRAIFSKLTLKEMR